MVDHNRGDLPTKVTGFIDGRLVECLMKAAVFLEDYNACAGMSAEDRRDMLARFSYKVGTFLSTLVFYTLYLQSNSSFA